MSSISRQQRRAAERRDRKLIDRFDQHGCFRCDQRPYHGVALDVGLPSLICSACYQPSDVPTSCVALLEESPAVRDDRAWFAEHPENQHRVRQIMPGEAGELGASRAMLAELNGWDAPQQIDPSCESVVVVALAENSRVRLPLKLAGLGEAERTAAIVEQVEMARGEAKNILETTYQHLEPADLTAINYASTIKEIARFVPGGSSLLKGVSVKGAAMHEARRSSKH